MIVFFTLVYHGTTPPPNEWVNVELLGSRSYKIKQLMVLVREASAWGQPS